MKLFDNNHDRANLSLEGHNGGGGEVMDLDMIQHPPSVSFKLIIRIFVVKVQIVHVRQRNVKNAK